MSILQAAINYADAGYTVVPAVPLGKRPAVQWRDLIHRDGEVVAEHWDIEPKHNVGIRTDGLIVLDVDDVSWLDAEKESSLAGAPIATTPRGGRHFFFRAPEDTQYRNSAGQVAPGVDIRANGGFIVLAPSMTDKGRYEWADGDLAETPVDRLPLPPQWLLDMLSNVATTRELQERIASGEQFSEGGRNNMLTSFMGMLRRSGVSEEGLFAAGMVKNREACTPELDEQEVRAIARSVSRYQPNALDTLVATGGTLAADQPLVVEDDPGAMPESLLNVPGIIGDACAYMLDTSPRRQPALCLASAISLMSICAAHKVRCANNIRPNVYCIGIAGTGHGKDRSLSGIEDILSLSHYGAERFSSDLATSEKGLLQQLVKHNPMLGVVDEAGKALSGTGRTGTEWGKSLAGMLLKLYSASQKKRVQSKSYSESKKNIEVAFPYYSMYGATTPHAMFGEGSLDSGSIFDGLFGRIFFFWGEPEKPKRMKVEYAPPDPTLVSRVDVWCNPDADFARDMGESYDVTMPKIVVVEVDAAAEAEIEAYLKLCDARCDAKDDPVRDIWGRVPEHVWKLATLYACSCFDPDNHVEIRITPDAVRWAIDLTQWLTQKTRFELFFQVSDSQTQADCNAVLGYLSRHGKCTRTDLGRVPLRHLKKKDRDAIYDTLLDAGQVVVEVEGTQTKPTTWFSLPGLRIAN